MRKIPGLFLLAGLCAGVAADAGAQPSGRLRVHADGRHLVRDDGTPFFWLGDTAWELFHRLTREEAARYLDDRRDKGFTVVQAVALAEFDGLTQPNAYGHLPLSERDPARPLVVDGPRNDYWDHVEEIVDMAAERGLYVGLLPTWGSHVLPLWAKDPVVFNDGNAETFGRFVATRFGGKTNIVWILGGDRPVAEKGADTLSVWRAMARGIRAVDTTHLITYHPKGGARSSTWLHDESWLDFHMMQSGHGGRDQPAWTWVEGDLALPNPKPTLDGEINYEDHPINWNPLNGYFRDADVRRQAWRTVLAGAAGVTYGNQCVWQMYDTGRTPIAGPEMPWHVAITRPGAAQMIHLRRAIESRPWLTSRADQSLLKANAPNPEGHIRVLRGDGFVMAYVPMGQTLTIVPTPFQGRRLVGWWFDPRTGAATRIGELGSTADLTLDPPGEPGLGNDWVLVLDERDRGWQAPGRSR
ncbi:MAG TPA: glycoside hydrolase family 140 protein [Luteitalea sp.]|nr:glycoside hydrolase family 140 protein [Luteitalea sp.]